MSKEILMYTTSTCPFCIGAKSWLTERGHAFQEVSLNDATARTKFKEDHPGLNTVPQIFVDGELLGGFRELQEKGDAALV